MQHALSYSIIEHIKAQVPEVNSVDLLYDGVNLTDKTKPFVTVEMMPEASDLLAAGRQDYEETYRYQVGVYCASITEKLTLPDVVKRALRQPNIPFYNTSIYPPEEVGVFVCDVNAVTPIPVEDTAEETKKHHVYLDVEVTLYRKNGDTNKFTQ